MRYIAVGVLGVSLLSSLLGCGDGKGAVNGTVTFDGKPVPKGTITFVRTEGGLAREGAIITDGNFQAKVPPGKYKIELNAQRVVSKRKQKDFDGKEEEVEVTEELFPERFNTKSELSEQIKAGGNPIKLDLKSKP